MSLAREHNATVGDAEQHSAAPHLPCWPLPRRSRCGRAAPVAAGGGRPWSGASMRGSGRMARGARGA